MKTTSAMVSTLSDKYSRLLDKFLYVRIQKFDLIRVGVMIMPDMSTLDRRIMVGVPPVAGSAADRVGMKVGDYIVEVNGVETGGRLSILSIRLGRC